MRTDHPALLDLDPGRRGRVGRRIGTLSFSHVNSWRLVAMVGAITVVGAALRFVGLGRQSFWIDEVVTSDLLRHSLRSLVFTGIPSSESTPPLYYVLAWGWVRLFGSGEVALRSLSALLGTATVPVMFLAVRSLTTARTAVIAAALVAVSPILVWYSQEARSYALFSCLASLTLLFFARLRERYSRRDLIAWSAVAVLALVTHYFAYFLVAGEVVFLWRRLPWRSLVAGLAPLVLVTLPLARLAHDQQGNAGGLAGSTGFWVRVGQLGRWFATGNLDSPALWSVVAAAAVLAGVLLQAEGTRRERRGAGVVVGVAAVAALIPLLLAGAGRDYVFFRNFIAVWLLVAVVVAGGIAAARPRLLGVAILLVLLGSSVAADAVVWSRSSLERDDYRGLAKLLEKQGGGAVVVYPDWDAQPLEHYDRALVPLGGIASVRTLWFVGVRSNYDAWRDPGDLRLAVPAGFRAERGRAYQHFFIRRYVARHPVRIGAAPPRATGSGNASVPRSRVLVSKGMRG